MNKKSGIYIIKTIINNKTYIGSAVSINRRIRDHKNMLLKHKHYNKKLQNHYNKYGSKSLVFEILEYCDVSILIEREQFHIDNLKPVFNICKIAGSSSGRTHTMSQSARDSISKSRKGKPRGYSVTIHRGKTNVNAKKVVRIDNNGNEKIYGSLSSVQEDGIYFQNVHKAIKKGWKHHGYIWKYL